MTTVVTVAIGTEEVLGLRADVERTLQPQRLARRTTLRTAVGGSR